MRHNYTQPQSPQTYRRIYAGFKGLDTVNAPIHVDPSRSPYCQNVIIDAAGVVHKRPPIYQHKAFGIMASVYGIFPFLLEETATRQPYDRNALVVVAKYALPGADTATCNLLLYRRLFANHLPNDPTVLCTDMNEQICNGFQHGKRFYVMDGKTMRAIIYDEESEDFVVRTVQELATAPETQIDGYYHAETYTDENNQEQTQYTWTFGEKGERNLLTARRVNTFAGDGVHTKFYLDAPNVNVTKVELFSPTVTTAGSTDTVTTVAYNSNVRNKPSQTNGAIIGVAPPSTTYTVYSKTGKWYRIEFPNATEAYIHQDRIASYNAGGGSTTVMTNTEEWEEITTGYTVREADAASPHNDEVINCTVVEFTTAPSAHPRGVGLPNIRVTGAELETVVISKKQPSGAGQSNIKIIIPNSDIVINTEVKINGTVQTLGTDYIVEKDGNRQTWVIVYGIVNNVQKLHSGDTVTLTYKRENLRDHEIINQCRIYGRYGVYNHDRWFYTGNKSDINRDWYSESGDPTLVLENSYTDIGMEQNGIAGYLNYQSEMIIVKFDAERECIYRRTASSDGDMTVFHVKSYVGRGAVNERALINAKGMALYVSPEGLMEFVSSDLNSKYAVQCRSSIINNRLAPDSVTSMSLWGNRLIISRDGYDAFVADLNRPTAPSESGAYGFEFTYWTIPTYAGVAAYDSLWFTLNADICSMPLSEEWYEYADHFSAADPTEKTPIIAIWTTPCDMLDEPARYKYIEKRGGLINLANNNSNLHLSQKRLKYTIITDSKDVPVSFETAVDMLSCPTDYDVIDAAGAQDVPLVIFNERVSRFRYVQFSFRNDDPATDGIEILSLEFQYRFGRYII